MTRRDINENAALSYLLGGMVLALAWPWLSHAAGREGSSDQGHECEGQAHGDQCKVSKGEAGQFVRRVFDGPGQTLDLYQDKDGGWKVVTRAVPPVPAGPNPPDRSAEAPDTEVCFDCYQRAYDEAIKFLDELEPATKENVSISSLNRIGDFVQSRAGVLIHDECFQQYGGHVEKWVTDAVYEGLDGHIDSEFKYSVYAKFARERNERLERPSQPAENDRYFHPRGMSYYSHFPRLMSLLSPQLRGDAFKQGVLLEIDGTTVLLEKPCEDVLSLPIGMKDRIHTDNCNFSGKFTLTQPKVICQADAFAVAVSVFNRNFGFGNGRTRAYATNPNTANPVFVNTGNKTEAYNFPVIAIPPPHRGDSGKHEEGDFKLLLWHELLHNAGYDHEERDAEGKEVPEYAHFCSFMTFGKNFSSSDQTLGSAKSNCEDEKVNRHHPENLQTIRMIQSRTGYPVN